MLNNRRRRRTQANVQLRHGVVAVEFAVVAPVFFLLIFASIEFTRMNIIRHTADNAAYEAARHAMVPGATAAEATRLANTILNIVGTRGAQVTLEPPTLGPDVEELTVTVEVPMGQNGWIVPRFSGSTVMRSQATMKTERTGR